MSSRDESIRSFCAATGAPPHAAPQYLESASWDVATAIQMYRANVEMNGNNSTPVAYSVSAVPMQQPYSSQQQYPNPQQQQKFYAQGSPYAGDAYNGYPPPQPAPGYYNQQQGGQTVSRGEELCCCLGLLALCCCLF